MVATITPEGSRCHADTIVCALTLPFQLSFQATPVHEPNSQSFLPPAAKGGMLRTVERILSTSRQPAATTRLISTPKMRCMHLVV